MNRIESAVRSTQHQLDTLGRKPSLEVEEAATLDMEMYVLMQELKSLAVADGVLSLEEGQTLYGYLGNTPEHFNRQSLAVRMTGVRLLEELLRRSRAKAIAPNYTHAAVNR